MPELSVIVPTYNGRRFLRTALLSLLSQSDLCLEIIVIDDGSTEGVLDSIRDLPVTFVRFERNCGIPAAYNHALSMATGELVTFLDHDDISVPGGLSQVVEWMHRHPEIACVRGEVSDIIDEAGARLGTFSEIFHPLPPIQDCLTFNELSNPEFQRGAFLCALWLHVLRRDATLAVGRFDESLRVAHDVDFLIRILKAFPIHVLPIPLVRYRIHSTNTSGRLEEGRFHAFPRTVAESTLVAWAHGITL